MVINFVEIDLVAANAQHNSGDHVEEITPGFICNGQLLRLAEVKVNKLKHPLAKVSIPSQK